MLVLSTQQSTPKRYANWCAMALLFNARSASFPLICITLRENIRHLASSMIESTPTSDATPSTGLYGFLKATCTRSWRFYRRSWWRSLPRMCPCWWASRVRTPVWASRYVFVALRVFSGRARTYNCATCLDALAGLAVDRPYVPGLLPASSASGGVEADAPDGGGRDAPGHAGGARQQEPLREPVRAPGVAVHGAGLLARLGGVDHHHARHALSRLRCGGGAGCEGGDTFRCGAREAQACWRSTATRT